MGPNFLFFFPFPITVSLFLGLSGCLLVEFWCCLKRRSPQMCTFGVLGLSCETPAAPTRPGRRGSHTTAREPKRTHFRVPAFKTPPKFHEETPRETQKERNGGGKGKKKSEILGGPAEGGPGKSKPATTTTTTTTTTPNPEQVGPRRAGPLSQARFRVCVFRGWAQQHVRGVSWSEVATVPKRKSHRSLDFNLSWNSEEDI